MNMDSQIDLPGGADYIDVTNLIKQAANEMDPGEVIMSDGFTLQDAMSAFEIGEPRLDSGFIQDLGPPFDPLSPLLPQELCWILDRSFTCEMEWHASNTLSQTIFSFLFVHHLDDIDPDFLSCDPPMKEDPSRPRELITVVLRSAVFGLLKCCDLAWRGFFNGGLQDGEDWQAEKCDVSLREGLPVRQVLSGLDEAALWLSTSSKVSSLWRDAILARIILRKTLLELLVLRAFGDHMKFQVLIKTAREQLQAIRDLPSPQPPSDSPAFLSFDPLGARSLNTSIPLRAIEMRSITQTWDAMDLLFDGWCELDALSTTLNLSTWAVAGNLWLWLPEPQRLPYIRSSIQSIFFDGDHVLNKYPPAWVTDRFFTETMGITYGTIYRIIVDGSPSFDSPPCADLDRHILQVLITYIRGLWYNPPRRRRCLMKSLLDWHMLYDSLINIVSRLNIDDNHETKIIEQIPNAALIWRLSVVREVVFSGFQLELYSTDEKPVAYWYIAQVIEAHIACLDRIMEVIPKDSEAYVEMVFQSHFLTALKIMSTAIFSVTMKSISLPEQRMEVNFLRRYKWAFRPEYNGIKTSMIAPPRFSAFKSACEEMSKDESYSPSDSIKMAKDILTNLVDHPTGWAGSWGQDRSRFVRDLADTCGRLYTLPATVKDLSLFDVSRLKWDPRTNAWFPSLIRFQS